MDAPASAATPRRPHRTGLAAPPPVPDSVDQVSSKTEHQAARQRVADYHEQCVSGLIDHVAKAIDRYRAGEIDAHAVDEAIHQYHRAARELWKFCWSSGGGLDVEFIAQVIDEQTAKNAAPDWWQRGAPRPR
jgi:hypothetical protein